MSVDAVSDKINADYEKLLQNVFLYGIGVMITEMEDGGLSSRVVPIEEYTELGEHLKWVDQSTKGTR